MDVPARELYSTDLTDAQWAILEPLIPSCKHGGRPRCHSPIEMSPVSHK